MELTQTLHILVVMSRHRKPRPLIDGLATFSAAFQNRRAIEAREQGHTCWIVPVEVPTNECEFDFKGLVLA